MRHFTGMQYLQMDIAANYGLDKATWDERLEWYQTNKKVIEEGSEEETKNFLRLADKPAQVIAGIFAMRDTLEGKPTGYMCGLDATASGLQILSTLIGCHNGAALCNLIDNGECNDAYMIAYEVHNMRLKLPPEIKRKQYKAALMTHLYGSVREPEIAFGKGTDHLSMFYEVIDALLPKADTLNRWLISCWDPEKRVNEWVLPDGFTAVVKVVAYNETEVNFLGSPYKIKFHTNDPVPTSKSLGANIVHSVDGMVVREMVRRCNYDKKHLQVIHKNLVNALHAKVLSSEKDYNALIQIELWRSSGFMSWRLFDELSCNTMGFLTVQEKEYLIEVLEGIKHNPFELVAIHDCFRFPADQGNVVRKVYRHIFAEMAESSLLGHIMRMLSNFDGFTSVPQPALARLIRNSEYAIS